MENQQNIMRGDKIKIVKNPLKSDWLNNIKRGRAVAVFWDGSHDAIVVQPKRLSSSVVSIHLLFNARSADEWVGTIERWDNNQ